MAIRRSLDVIYPSGTAPISGRGPTNARIMVVGEAPGADEAKAGVPFIGMSGKELEKMLQDAGIDPSSVYYTNVVLVRPPANDIDNWVYRKPKFSKTVTKVEKKYGIDREAFQPFRYWQVQSFVKSDVESLAEEIKRIKPNVILALGNVALWALCDTGDEKVSVAKWRGSTLISDLVPGVKVIPAYHPAFILRAWEHRKITVQDFRRALAASASPVYTPPAWDFTPFPTFNEAYTFLNDLRKRMDAGERVPMTCDVECAGGKTLCVGIGVSSTKAMCLPWYHKDKFYWTENEGVVINFLLYKVLTHKNAQVCNQNLPFDTQWLFKDFFIIPRAVCDTMIAQSVIFPGTKMALDYLASMYCANYTYWKDDGKFWVTGVIEWDKLFKYNCEDCARTFEVWQTQMGAIRALNRLLQFKFLMLRLYGKAIRLMFRGVRRDAALAAEYLSELMLVVHYAQARVMFLSGRDLMAKTDWSNDKLQDFFYKEMKLEPVLSDEGVPTCDGDALVTLAKREPLVAEIVRWITMHRSYSEAIGVCQAVADPDGRWRCSYSMGLVETYRFGSSKNAFGRGLNLQNITSGKKTKGEE